MPLPIEQVIPDLVEALTRHGSAVLVAPPGAGKSTRVPPALLAARLLHEPNPAIVMLQPRRVAARAVALRIAAEQAWQPGREVGFHVRFDRQVSRETRLRVLTEGILTRQLLADPFLEGVGLVILDEFHERHLQSDLALAWLAEVRQTVRPDLKILVMSATLEAEPVARFLGGCPVVQVPARVHPIRIEYRPAPHAAVPLAEQVAGAAAHVLESGEAESSDILVFLPGVGEIQAAARRVAALAARHEREVLPLHGSLPASEQDRALRPGGKRRIILATNIAETSLTIDGVRTVIDSGLVRSIRNDPDRGIERLELGRVSRASADQRAGRAARLGPGLCIRLWEEREHARRPAFDLPEVMRVDLAGTVLALHAWGTRDPRAFGWFERPSDDAIVSAERLLTMLGALDGKGMTRLGQAMLEIPAHPRIARMLLAAVAWGVESVGAEIAALIESRDLAWQPRDRSAGRAPAMRPDQPVSTSDLFDRIERLRLAERERFAPHLIERAIDPGAARQVALTREELLRILDRVRARAQFWPIPCPVAPVEDHAVELLPLVAFPDRVCRRRLHDPMSGTMVGRRGVRLEPGSSVREGALFVAIRLRDDARRVRNRGEARVAMAGSIEPDWLDALAPGSVRLESTVRFDPERQRVVGIATQRFFDLVLKRSAHGRVDRDAAGAVLAEALASPDQLDPILQADPATARWVARLNFLASLEPDLPALDHIAWRTVLTQACTGLVSARELKRRPLLPYLVGWLGYQRSSQLDAAAPDTLRLPSGRAAPIQYEPAQPPILAARVQELFGWHETPRIAGGRQPLLLHILGPNHRPVQVTSDLRSFWTSTYFQVRKDLRARYPKHNWPDDPWTAQATPARARRPPRPKGK